MKENAAGGSWQIVLKIAYALSIASRIIRTGKQIADVKIPVGIHICYVVALIPLSKTTDAKQNNKQTKQNKISKWYIRF